jgi:hypothetical protein
VDQCPRCGPHLKPADSGLILFVADSFAHPALTNHHNKVVGMNPECGWVRGCCVISERLTGTIAQWVPVPGALRAFGLDHQCLCL